MKSNLFSIDFDYEPKKFLIIYYIYLDLCAHLECQNGGKCEVENKQATCECPNRFIGKECEKGKIIINTFRTNFCIKYLNTFDSLIGI